MNEFFLSAESRWFQDGTIPEPVVMWFLQSPCCRKHAERTDLYLVFPNAKNIGVKWRECRLEIKILIDTVERFGVGHIHGNIEFWEKWSGREVPGQYLHFNTESQETWMQVHKSRILRLFSAETSGISECDIREAYVPLSRGCQMELTQIGINALTFWSIGFEAFSEHHDHLDILKGVMEHVFQTGDFPGQLYRDHVGSYPELLHRVHYNS